MVVNVLDIFYGINFIRYLRNVTSVLHGKSVETEVTIISKYGIYTNILSFLAFFIALIASILDGIDNEYGIIVHIFGNTCTDLISILIFIMKIKIDILQDNKINNKRLQGSKKNNVIKATDKVTENDSVTHNT